MKLISGLAAAALTVTALAHPAAAAPPASDATGDRAVDAAARWVTGQLTDGLVYNDQFGGFDDYGLSADVAFALHAVGRDDTVTDIVEAIEPDADSWAGGAERVYAGSLAKLVSLVQVAGRDATAYNGTDQVERLESLVADSTLLTGRLEDSGVDPDDPWDADFVNVIGQSFAARALTTADSPVADEATGFLLDQQCNEGFFRATLTADKTSPAQACDSESDTGSVDTTALAVINILGTPGASTRARGAAALAASWLRTQQAADGSFSAGGAEGYNANSTGLAAWALGEAGHTGSATKAAGWLRGVQVADLAPCATTLAADNGALAFKPSILDSARASGIAPGERDQYRRATAQALPALAFVPESVGAVAVSAPATAVEGSTVTVTVSGLGAGEAGCVSLGALAKPVTGTGGPVSVAFQLPAGVAAQTFRLTTLAGSVTATTTTTAAPAPTTPAAPVVGDLAVTKVEKVRKNTFTLEVGCDAAQACAGKVKVSTAGKVELTQGKKVLTVAKRSYRVSAGGEKKLVLRLTKPARRLLADGGVRVRAVQTAPGARRAVTTFRLKRAKG